MDIRKEIERRSFGTVDAGSEVAQSLAEYIKNLLPDWTKVEDGLPEDSREYVVLVSCDGDLSFKVSAYLPNIQIWERVPEGEVLKWLEIKGHLEMGIK